MIQTIAPGGEVALAITEAYVITDYMPVERYYSGYALMSNPTVIKEGKLTKEDLNRHFRISFKVWDYDTRNITVALNGCTSQAERFNDYQRVIQNVKTKAGEWISFSFEYTVYEPEYGEMGEIEKTLTLNAILLGNAHKPIYFKDFVVEEFV